MLQFAQDLQLTDPEIANALQLEKERQNTHLELIASENFVSHAILEAQGSVLTNKYAEGYPGKRYYGGCEHMDTVETLAKERALALFGGEHVNVQPHSGAQANMGVYLAMLQPGDTIMGLSLDCGGHLTHGSPANFSGKLFKVIPYGVTKDRETIDYDQLRSLAKEHRPKMIVGGASAYPRIIDFKTMREIALEVGALLMVDMAHIAGLVATGLHPSPIPHAHFVTTTTHKTLRGPRGGIIFCKEEFAKAIDKTIFPGIQGGPLMHVIAAKAVALKEALSPEFKTYQSQVVANAKTLAKTLAQKGARIVSGGTDNHLMLVDVTTLGLSGKEAEEALDQANITVNKNKIPYDPKPATVTSGLRIGTPAITTRGMKENEMEKIADIIVKVLKNIGNHTIIEEAKKEVLRVCQAFPLY